MKIGYKPGLGPCTWGPNGPEIIGNSPAIVAARTWADGAALSTCTVLLDGESGVGHRTFAAYIHRRGHDAQSPFVVSSMRGVEQESALFGDGDRIGAIRQARGGTLYLVHPADLSRSAQIRLWQHLQSESGLGCRLILGEYGEHRLPTAAGYGDFRSDLFDCLLPVDHTIPPLRGRTGDPRVLLDYFLSRYAAPITYGEEVSARVERYRWPGNVRELEATVTRAVHLSPDEGILDPRWFPEG